MTKIAFLSRYQNSIQRGAETFVQELSTQLSKENQVDILFGNRADSLHEIINGNYQIVVAVNGGLQSLKASLGRLKSGYKLVISGQAGMGKGEVFNLVVAKPDLYVALTEVMYQWAKHWVWGSQLITIPNGVNLQRFQPKGEKAVLHVDGPIILSVGALVWYKHHEKTIKAVSLMNEGTLVIVGEGPEKNNLEALGRKMLGNRFRIISAQYQDLPKIYRAASIFVLPSWDREAFGIVYLEAMASGLGVIAPDDPSRNEIIEKAGILVDVSNTQIYAQAIQQGLKLDWKTSAINQAKKFSWDKVASRYEQAFKTLL